MTSRFREELALRPGRARTGRRCGPGHRRDRRSGGLLQRPDRPARAARAGPVRVHDPALGRDRRGDRRRARGRVGADPAAGHPDDPRLAGRPLRRPPGRHRRRRRTAPGRGSRAGSCATRSRCSSRRSLFLLVLGSPFLHVRFNAPDAIDPAARGPVAGGLRPPPGRVRRGRVRPDRAGHPDDRRRRRPRTNLAALYDYSRRLAARPTDRPCRQPGRRRSAPDARPVHAPLRRPERAARPVRPDRSGGDDPWRPDRVHAVHAVRPEPRRGSGARRRPAQRRTARSRRQPG